MPKLGFGNKLPDPRGGGRRGGDDAREAPDKKPRRGRGRGGDGIFSSDEEYELADGYEIVEEESGYINRLSLKRSRKFLFIALAFMAFCIVLFVVYLLFHNLGVNGREHSCWEQEQAVEALADQYVRENGLSSYPAYIEDIPGFTDANITCPDGGTYTWEPISGQFSCSEHGHWPDGFNQAQSKSQGTNTTVVPANQ